MTKPFLNKTSISPYITPEGQKRLSEELSYLWKIKRPQVTQAVAEAAAMGDRSENAEYIYGKKRLREIDKRLQYLSKLLKDPVVIDSSKVDPSVVSFGCRVTVTDDNSQTKIWTIVGEGEADVKERTISVEAPVARALLGKSVHDVVEVELERGTTYFTIEAITRGDID